MLRILLFRVLYYGPLFSETTLSKLPVNTTWVVRGQKFVKLRVNLEPNKRITLVSWTCQLEMAFRFQQTAVECRAASSTEG